MVFDDGSMRRRRLLTLAGGTVTIAVAGCLDEEDPDDTDDDTDDTDDDQEDENGETENGETDGEDEDEEPELEGISLDVSDTLLTVDGEATLTVTAEYDDGSEETVTGDATITSDDDAIVSVADETVSWSGDGTVSITAEYEGFEDTVELEAEEDDDEEEEPFELGDEFDAEGVGGYISFAEESEEEAEEEGISFAPEDLDEPPVIEGMVSGNTWESTSVEFPEIDTGTAEATIEAIDGLSGDIDLENGQMTAEGTLEVTIDGDDSFEFAIAATSEASGDLSGTVDAEFAPATVTLVDNEYVVDDETGSAIIDGFLGLPADEPGENWLVLTVEITSE